MTSDDGILRVVDDAFGDVARPEHFTVADGDPECMDHDRLLHSRTTKTLTIEDVGHIGYDPLVECFPQGLAYFFPALARFALADSRPHDWYAFQLALHLTRDGTANRFLNFCTDSQKAAVFAVFAHIQTTWAEKIESECCAEEIENCVALWRD
ncbi:hypothetical protein IV454_15665 [Massilia antarctica]|uniref:Uncharacterized protein n=1 Tax=Massilia antarctica TaxID=2765360 RepID=A0AA48WIT5_9BURK|nr:hypothetical protein [Massilia antarctica]QPI52791.1 hypothetical protein IV454_15665 [Massilia antarctica]